jgi:CIC family chloride channel protein
MRRLRTGEIIDAVEANALYGGRMSVIDSLNLALLTVCSAGAGASVGLEAAYTQLSASLASKFGSAIRLRRDDMRTMVGCGAAGAIAAAFNAPLAGAFYAFELIVGNYTPRNLAPIMVAAVASTLTQRLTFGADTIFFVDRPVRLAPHDYLLFVLLGLGAAGLAILLMRGVTAIEAWLRRCRVPTWLRPAVGGAAVGAIALAFPSALGSGHGGIVLILHFDFDLMLLIGMMAAKILASALSIGAGFRGGLFSSSLFIGILFGRAAGILLATAAPLWNPDPVAYSLVGMGAVAAAVVGAPIAMILLVLELTGDYSATFGVMLGVVAATLVVRRWFGYSFATWRFHLRGLRIHGAEDVGWTSDLKAGQLMATDIKTVPTGMGVASLRKLFPLGGSKQVFAIDGRRLAGAVDMIAVHDSERLAEEGEPTAADFLRGAGEYLLAADDIATAIRQFTHLQAELLPVVDNANDLVPIGYLTEAATLRRYSQELEQRQGGTGRDLLSTAAGPPA